MFFSLKFVFFIEFLLKVNIKIRGINMVVIIGMKWYSCYVCVLVSEVSDLICLLYVIYSFNSFFKFLIVSVERIVVWRLLVE